MSRAKGKITGDLLCTERPLLRSPPLGRPGSDTLYLALPPPSPLFLLPSSSHETSVGQSCNAGDGGGGICAQGSSRGGMEVGCQMGSQSPPLEAARQLSTLLSSPARPRQCLAGVAGGWMLPCATLAGTWILGRQPWSERQSRPSTGCFHGADRRPAWAAWRRRGIGRGGWVLQLPFSSRSEGQ
jgi:hypothetical protein